MYQKAASERYHPFISLADRRLARRRRAQRWGCKLTHVHQSSIGRCARARGMTWSRDLPVHSLKVPMHAHITIPRDSGEGCSLAVAAMRVVDVVDGDPLSAQASVRATVEAIFRPELKRKACSRRSRRLLAGSIAHREVASLTGRDQLSGRTNRRNDTLCDRCSASSVVS